MLMHLWWYYNNNNKHPFHFVWPVTTKTWFTMCKQDTKAFSSIVRARTYTYLHKTHEKRRKFLWEIGRYSYTHVHTYIWLNSPHTHKIPKKIQKNLLLNTNFSWKTYLQRWGHSQNTIKKACSYTYIGQRAHLSSDHKPSTRTINEK